MTHDIDIFTELDDLDNLDSISQTINKCVNETLLHIGVDFPCHIDVEITNNNEIALINKEHREKDYATDVLSFPMAEFSNGELLDDLDMCVDPDTGFFMLGDMILSYEKILQQAKEFEHSNERELAFLVVHSTLHLIGFDHELEDENADIMRAKEKEIMNILNITR